MASGFRSSAIDRAIRIGLAALLLVVLAAAGCRSDVGPQLAPLAPDARILAFGDSLTYGSDEAPDQSYPAQLGRLLGRPVVKSGVPGETTEQGLARLPRELDRVDPGLLLLWLGGNDFLRRIDPAHIEANLARMIEIARERGIAVLLIGVPPLGLVSLRGAELYERLAQRYGLPLENDVFAEVLSDRDLMLDLIHPNGRGNERIAEAIRDRLHAAGAV